MTNQGAGPTKPASAPSVHDTDRTSTEHPTTVGETTGKKTPTPRVAEEQERARREKIAQKARNRRKRNQREPASVSPPTTSTEDCKSTDKKTAANGGSKDNNSSKDKHKNKTEEKNKDKGKTRDKKSPKSRATSEKRYEWTSVGGGGARKESKKQQKIRQKMEEKRRRKAEKASQAKQKEKQKEKTKYYRPASPPKMFTSKMYAASYEVFKQTMSGYTSKPDLRRWYYKQCLRHHPDKGGDVESFKALTEAYNDMLLFL